MDRIYFGIRMSLAIGEGPLSKQSDPPAHENSDGVWRSRRDYLSKKEPQGL